MICNEKTISEFAAFGHITNTELYSVVVRHVLYTFYRENITQSTVFNRRNSRRPYYVSRTTEHRNGGLNMLR
jgi:hypothetical protein